MIMTDPLDIRRYRPADADAVRAVHERAIRASPLGFAADAAVDADLDAITDRYLATGGTFLVGDHADDGIVAIGGLLRRDPATAELRRLRVDPDHQRQGYGRRLVVALEECAREDGFERIVLETHERLTAARRLYESRGYRAIGREADTITDGDLIRYQKPL